MILVKDRGAVFFDEIFVPDLVALHQEVEANTHEVARPDAGIISFNHLSQGRNKDHDRIKNPVTPALLEGRRGQSQSGETPTIISGTALHQSRMEDNEDELRQHLLEQNNIIPVEITDLIRKGLTSDPNRDDVKDLIKQHNPKFESRSFKLVSRDGQFA